jgi:DNA-binding LytR/AlgR family response regulator
LKVVICDDDIQDAKQAEQIAAEYFANTDCSIEILTPTEAKLVLEEDLLQTDILIMDIEFQMDGFNGIDLSALVNEKLPACQIIYLSQIIEFAPEVYETRHCYFVTKENMKLRLPKALDKAMLAYEEALDNEVLEIISNGHKVYILRREILYVERCQRFLKLHTTKNVYDCYSSLKAIDKKLGFPFVRCYGSFIVNLAFIEDVVHHEARLSDGTVLQIGRDYYNDFMKKYMEYFVQKM